MKSGTDTNEFDIVGKYWTFNYEEDYDARSEALARAMQESLILERNPASHGTPTDARSPHSVPAPAKEYEFTFQSPELIMLPPAVTIAC